MKKSNHTKNSVSSKITLQKWRNQLFVRQQKLRKFVTIRPVLQEMLKILQREGKYTEAWKHIKKVS